MSVPGAAEQLHFQETRIRDKKSFRKSARENELREYLGSHNDKMARSTGETFRQERIYKHLMDGVALSGSPEKEVHDNLMFTAPTKNRRGKKRGNKFISEVYRTARFPAAVDVISKYDKDDRWAAGMNANTLMTEYRRKVLFHALLDTGDVEEDRQEAQEKVKRYILVNHPEELVDEDKEAILLADSVGADGGDMRTEHKEREALEREMAAKAWKHTLRGRDNRKAAPGEIADVTTPAVRSVLAEEFSTTGKYANFIGGSLDRLSTGGQTQTQSLKQPIADTMHDPRCNFQPKADDYDVMHNRWRYIKPELTSLLDRKSMAGSTITRQVHSPASGSIVTGSFRDVITYEGIYEKKQARIVSCETVREQKSVNTLATRYSMGSIDNVI